MLVHAGFELLLVDELNTISGAKLSLLAAMLTGSIECQF